MKTLIAAVMVAGVFSVAGSVQTASADSDAKCKGQIVAGIAATWPWAHDGRSEFPPAPGAIALWLQEFGPDIGVTSVNELQAMFCDAG
jgi:hypothetical protein